MNKKQTAFLMSFVLLLTLTACGAVHQVDENNTGDKPIMEGTATDQFLDSDSPERTIETSQTETHAESGEASQKVGKNKVLIAYFSATNNTEEIANHLDTILDADLYEIVPEIPYTSEDLNYNNSSSRTTIEMNDPDARPAISGSVENMEDYDIIFLGYPIWWGQAPRIVSTFLENYDLSGKTIVPFCTSGSSGIGSSAANLHNLATDAAWLDGQRFSSGASQDTVQSWVNGLGLDFGSSEEG